MKKIAFFAAAALCSPLAMAQEAPVVAACTPAEAEAMVDEVIAVLNEVVTTMESVKDTASADAAATKLEALQVRMTEAQTKMESLGSPDEATQEKLAEKLLPALFMLAPRMEAAATSIMENDCYGSEALKAIMMSM
ncbi:MAG: hypothetical protein E7031_03465 [Akkermansiaceae bacterium]|nr:hypothetical protein [Akkermansiaceae bacterium]